MAICGRGGTGRRAGFKIRFCKECRFDSDRPHQNWSSFEEPTHGTRDAKLKLLSSI